MAKRKARAASTGRDARQALRESEARFRCVSNLSSDWFWEQDAEFRFTRVEGRNVAGGDRALASSLLGKRRWDTGLDIDGGWDAHRALLEAHQPFRDLLMHRAMPNGEQRIISVSGEPVFDARGRFRGYRGIGRIVTEQKRTEAALRESEARFRSLTQMSSDLFWETDAAHRFTEVVHGANTFPSQLEGMLAGKTPWDMATASPDAAGWAALRETMDAQRTFRDFEFSRVLADGTTRYLSFSGEPRRAPDGRFLGYRGVGRDVTQTALARERIATLAYRDALTGLANRVSLGPALEHAVLRSRRDSAKLAALYVDLDGFKRINDEHGHDVGDDLLVEVAARLRAALRASDLVARLGGDEFLVLLEQVEDAAQVETVARKLLADLDRPYRLVPGSETRISASIGVSLFPDDAEDAASLVKHADMAMYRAKQGGKNAYRLFAGQPA